MLDLKKDLKTERGRFQPPPAAFAFASFSSHSSIYPAILVLLMALLKWGTAALGSPASRSVSPCFEREHGPFCQFGPLYAISSVSTASYHSTTCSTALSRTSFVNSTQFAFEWWTSFGALPFEVGSASQEK